MIPLRRAALALLALAACTACASGRVEPVLDLTPWTWTGSQAALGAFVIRYGFPDDPTQALATRAAAAPELAPVEAGMLRLAARSAGPQAPTTPGATRFASFRYDCAREDRAERAACSVFLDFWLLELDPPLVTATLAAYQERFEGLYANAAPPANGFSRRVCLDSRGREWLGRAVALRSGAGFSHYSRPIDSRTALAVTSYTSRAPDRVLARDLARDAIDRILVEVRP